MSGTMVVDWLPRTLLGGGGLLLLAWLAMGRLAAPARRQRLGEWAMTAALLLALLSVAPAWLIVSLPAVPSATVETEPAAPVEEESPPRLDAGVAEEPAVAIAPWLPVAAPPREEDAAAEPIRQPAPGRDLEEGEKPAPAETPARGERLARRSIAAALALYASGAVLLLGRWLLGHVVLWRMLRRAEPVPDAVAELFASMTRDCHRARLLLSKRARVPFSCGLLRPTVVLPAALGRNAAPAVLRWIFAHELTHLRRRDAWASLLFGLGQVLYFPLPWFWRLRRQVRLCQEYIADAAAAALGCPEDYAEFLLNWTAAPAAPAGLPGVSGSSSDLFWRITMLLKSPAPVEARCPRRWSLLAAAGLLTLAVLTAGVGLVVQAAPVPVKKDKPKKDETKKDEPKKAEPAKEVDPVEEMLKRLPPGTDPDIIEQTRKSMEQAMRGMTAEQRKQMVEMMRGMRPAAGLVGVPPGMPQGMMMPPGMGGWDHRRDARLGARIESPGATLAEQLDLPKGQGLVLREVPKDSAADKAGLKPHDILLELNGKPVPDRLEGLSKLMADIKADAAVDAVVLRKGKKETIKDLKLPEAKAVAPGFGAGAFFPPGGVQGGFNPPGLFPNPAALPGMMPPGAGGHAMMMTMFRTKERFTTRHQEGSLVITLTGKVSDGKAKVNEIHVQDSRESNKYESADKVPEQYRDKVKNLLDLTEKGPTIHVDP